MNIFKKLRLFSIKRKDAKRYVWIVSDNLTEYDSDDVLCASDQRIVSVVSTQKEAIRKIEQEINFFKTRSDYELIGGEADHFGGNYYGVSVYRFDPNEITGETDRYREEHLYCHERYSIGY